ncbi:hypothetical protein VN97_g10723 [Penicillium thymicola]|uniref:Aminoacyl-transfer RNA synthetases class-II family profile domain-containing protein n=1 Tax=Penicillium thymicola TaxID=293382 RepID=A0AAI9X3N7_PENTH|nr:hypothetical protein VN97_g10723 [Penicillium thymicola]
MEVLGIQSNLVPTPHHQALGHLYLTSKKSKVDVKTTKFFQDEKNPRTTEEKRLVPKLWKDPQTYTVQALHSPWHRTMLRIQSALFHTSIDFFRHKMNYEYLVVPLTTGSISSPMGLGSDSQPVSIQLNNKPTYLADSQQFLLEYALRLQEVPRGVYYAGTSCRGEDHDPTHLNQFCHVECELLGGLEAGMDVANQYIINLTQSLLASHGPEIALYAGTTSHMQHLLKLYSANNNYFPTITLSEVLALPELTNEMWEFVVPGDPAYGRLLTRKGEQMLIAKFGGACWLTEMDHLSVPFYQAYIPGNPTQQVAKAQCADFLLGMGEVLGCGNRHVSVDQAMRGLGEHGVNPEDYKWYLDMRKEKELETTGWGIGTERYLCWVLGHDDVRDVQIFPRLKGLECAP